MIDDPLQRRAFDRCMGYINAANSELQSITHNLLYQVEWIENLELVEVLRKSAVVARDMTGESVDQRKAKNWRKAKNLNVTELLSGLAEEIRVTLLELVLSLCGEYQAIETVRTELAEEFEDVDLVLPEIRQTVDDLGHRLQTLLMGLQGPKEMPSPQEEVLENIRGRLEHVFRYWRLIEIR
ncbi:MAG: hypothetical protein AB7V46_11680 [Thermomicrobiales bacterium]